jgi:hypothetical protein
MESTQIIDPYEIPNWENSCIPCKKYKTVLLRNHLAAASHNARVWVGHKMKFLRNPKTLQERLYKEEKKDVMMEIEYWLHSHETRHYALRNVISEFTFPLPAPIIKKCDHDESCPPTLYTGYEVLARPLLMKPAGINKFKIRDFVA